MPKLGLGLGIPKPLISGTPAPFIPSDIPGLLAFYNFENSGVTMPDMSGNGHELTPYPGIEAWEGVPGIASSNAVGFYGQGEDEGDMSQGDRFGTGDFAINPNLDFSVSVWMKPRNFSAFSHMLGAPFQNGLYIGGTDETVKFSLYNGTVFGIEAPAITPDTWHHYVFRRSDDELLLTADNIPVGTGVSVFGESFAGASILSVGGGEYDEYYYNGDMDALGFWQSSISDADIAKLWNNGTGVQMP
jgi:hypothetical protein